MRTKIGLFLLLAALLCAVPAFAAASGDPIKKYGLPLLITNAGQGPGGKMARLLVAQTKTIVLDTDYWYKSEPWEADIVDRPYQALMFVIGSSDKGLGASGITIEQEIARLEKIVKHAKDKKIPIIAVLLEKDKRSAIASNPNERCIDTVCPFADWMIVVKDGNKDGRFDKLKAKHKIPLTLIDNAIDFTQLCKQSFAK
ncbi:MAG TPA: DUF6305 family protein [Spirochaetales bacterium]|nr:DUF6305 family protein [Spirochaetales bacterium]HRY53160.1 DUF6305 family protein [Spirochaetia bacterium]HRZ63299.1 DUF6305 family protein [Spirochaetia bacterium]